jgi:hypothetical protein
MASNHVLATAADSSESADRYPRRQNRTADRFLLGLAAAKLLFHLVTANRYGIFRDEMYGLACANHLDWGYVDHPPGGIVIAWLASSLFGHSLLGLRFLPAVAGAALVWLTGIVTREMGGRTFAQALAAFAVCVVPIYAILDHWLMMNAFEPLVWLGCLWCAIRSIRADEGRYWIWFGLLAGVGVELKYSIVFLIAGLLLGLLLTPERRQMKHARLWLGLLLGVGLGLPNFIWQARHGFPFLELVRNVRASHRDVVRGPVAFMVDQAVIMQPMLAPLWIAGVGWLLCGRERKRYGALGWAFLVVVGAFVALHGKNYYATPIYPVAIAAGAIAFERVTASGVGKWFRVAYVAMTAVAGIVLLPLAAPVLSPATFLRYEARLGLAPPAFEHQNSGPLPQYFADEFGWEEMVQQVARVYHSLPPAEQSQTAIFSNNWGDAAAVDYFGPKYGLPPAISKNNSYWLWGARGYRGEIVIVLHTDGRGDKEHFAKVEKVGRVESPYSRRDEWFDIYLCRGLKGDLREMWPNLKSFD